MALTREQIAEIADDVTGLYEALQERGVDEELAGDWIGGGMMALIMNVTDPGINSNRDTDDGTLGPYPLREDHITIMDLKHPDAAGFAAEFGRPDPHRPVRIPYHLPVTDGELNDPGPWGPGTAAGVGVSPSLARAMLGNLEVDPNQGLAGIQRDVLERLALGPEPGTDMRLVALDSNEVATEPPQVRAMAWVRGNVPEAGKILTAEGAGITTAGDPVFLVTYELAEPS